MGMQKGYAHCDHCDQKGDEIEPEGHASPCEFDCNGEVCQHGRELLVNCAENCGEEYDY